MVSKRVLIVDDSRSARHVLKRQLRQHGITVDEVESAEDALQYLLYNTPHAIFMDHMMPGMDGLQAVRVIKGNPATGLIPILMFTSKEGGEVYLNQARALGAAGVLPKQIESSDLEAVLDSLQLLDAAESEAGSEAGTRPDSQTAGETVPLLQPSRPAPVMAGAESMARDVAGEELMRLIRPHLDTQARRLQSCVRAEVRELVERLQAKPAVSARLRWKSAATGLLLGILLTSSFHSLLPARAPLAATVVPSVSCPAVEGAP